ncbi:MAG: hypothetical protein KAH95_11470 [Spirochaetales bacterium]|nr:hypothetical protein [Spirochaetales bacterium]
MNKIIYLIVLIILFTSVLSFAQDAPEQFLEPYSRGSQTFSINIGLLVPLFILFPNQDDVYVPFGDQLSLGGTGSLEWAAFLNSRWSLGVGLAGTFAFTPQENTHSLIPITANLTYNYLFKSFEIPIIFGAGFAVNRVDEQVYFGSIAKLGTGFFWNMDAEWAFGLRTQYWIVPEIYFDSNSENTAYGNFLDIGLSAKFHF